MSALQEVMRFQTDRGLHLKPFDVGNENINIVEELLEAEGLDVSKEDRPDLRKTFRNFTKVVSAAGIATRVKDFTKEMMVDAYCDVIVFAVGAIMKLGYDPEKALAETAKEINSRKGSMMDGKFEKDLSPEAQAEWYKADYSKAEL